MYTEPEREKMANIINQAIETISLRRPSEADVRG